MATDRILSNIAVHGFVWARNAEAKRFQRAGRSARVAQTMAHILLTSILKANYENRALVSI